MTVIFLNGEKYDTIKKKIPLYIIINNKVYHTLKYLLSQPKKFYFIV